MRADKSGAASTQVAHTIRLLPQKSSYCTMGTARGSAENQERRTNGMGKKLGVGLLIVAGRAAGGAWTYRRYEAAQPKTLCPGEAATMGGPHHAEPAGGGAAR